jgi:hypothetical protein
MRNRTIIGALILVIALAGMLLAFRPSSVQAGSHSNESMESSCQKEVKDSKMIWENLSHQFFSTL